MAHGGIKRQVLGYHDFRRSDRLSSNLLPPPPLAFLPFSHNLSRNPRQQTRLTRHFCAARSLSLRQSLSELIRKTKRFTEDEARRYMLQILEATSYLHRHQIIHRDLKLGNVFLDRDWNIKVNFIFLLLPRACNEDQP